MIKLNIITFLTYLFVSIKSNAADIKCSKILMSPSENQSINQLAQIASLNCKLNNRTEPTPDYCLCIHKRDEIIGPKIQPKADQKDKFNSALLQTHGRTLKQSISRIILSIAQLEAESQLFSYRPKGLVAKSCNLDNMKTHLNNLTTKGCQENSGKDIANRLNIALDFNSSKST